MYAEVGRIKVNIVHEQSATAQVLHACESISVGDIAVPFSVKAAPPLKPSAAFDPFAPPTGKVNGTIISGREFAQTFGLRDFAYLDIGSKEGVAVGQYFRVYRPFENSARDRFRPFYQQYPEKIMGQRFGLNLTLAEQRMLPRDVLGEMVIVHVEGRSATGIFTVVRSAIYVGDQVELE